MGNRSSAPLSRAEHPPPKGVRPLSALPSVLVQTIMQLCDTCDLLRFARASTSLFHLADTAVAWRFNRWQFSTGTRFTDPRHGPWTVKPVASRLLKHASMYMREFEYNRLLQLAPCVPIVGIDASQTHSVTIKDWTTMFENEHLVRDLRELTLSVNPLNGAFDRSLGAMMAALKGLRTIHIVPAPQHNDSDELYMHLHLCPALTSVQLTDTHNRRQHSRMRYLSQCAGLRQLDLTAPALYGPDFRSFFTNPNLAGLESLSLCLMYCDGRPGLVGLEPISPEDYREAFSALVSLRLLKLQRCYVRNRLLEHLGCVSSLRSLHVVIEFDPFFADQERASSAEPIAQLMADNAELKCTVQLMLSTMSHGRSSQRPELSSHGIAFAAAVASQYNPDPERGSVLDAFRSRFRFETDLEQPVAAPLRMDRS